MHEVEDALGPPNPLLSVYSEETLEHTDKEMCTKMFIVAVVLLVTNCKPPQRFTRGVET